MSQLVCGVGLNDRKHPSWVNGKTTREYSLWHKLIIRCYYLKYHQGNPTYVGCQASENFKSYFYFYEWVQKQVGFGQKGFDLDKDLLFKGNKLYSEDTCVFLPRELNTLLTSCKAGRGSLPIGVTAEGKSFRAKCRTDKPSPWVGSFKTPEEAFRAYKQAKEAFIKRQAEKWKNFLDPRAFAALMAYEVSITD